LKKTTLTLVLVSLFAATAFAACPCGTLSVPNSVCTLTQNLASSGTCFTVAANNVTINCNGYTISGPSNYMFYYGVYSNRNYTQVQNCKINGFGSSVFFVNASYGTIQNTSANSSAIGNNDLTGNAIMLSSGSNYNTITNVTALSKSSFGIFMNSNANHNTVTNAILPSTFSGQSMSIRANHTIMSNISAPGYTQLAGTNNILANSTFLSFYLDPVGVTGNTRNVVYNNVFSSTGSSSIYALTVLSKGNTLYWNTFTGSGGYIKDYMPANMNSYNTTINGKSEGNLWGNVLNGSVNVTGSVASGYPGMALFVGSGGSGYPYKNTTSLGKIKGKAVDYAPLTPYHN